MTSLRITIKSLQLIVIFGISRIATLKALKTSFHIKLSDVFAVFL